MGLCQSRSAPRSVGQRRGHRSRNQTVRSVDCGRALGISPYLVLAPGERADRPDPAVEDSALLLRSQLSSVETTAREG